MKSALKSFYAEYPDLLARAQDARLQRRRGPCIGLTALRSSRYQLGIHFAIRCATTVILDGTAPWRLPSNIEFDAGTASHRRIIPRSSISSRLSARPGSGGELTQAVRSNAEVLDELCQDRAIRRGGVAEWPRYDAREREYVQFSNEGIRGQGRLRSAPCGVLAEKLYRIWMRGYKIALAGLVVLGGI